jgi:hypothetical protein
MLIFANTIRKEENWRDQLNVLVKESALLARSANQGDDDLRNNVEARRLLSQQKHIWRVL